MNYTETFDQFASRVTTTDLALYAGAGLIVWILFKEKLSPVQQFLSNLLAKVKGSTTTIIPAIQPVAAVTKEDVFFELVASWKQTRDLAVKCGCDQAVKVADQMFPYLSPVVCSKQQTEEVVK